MSRRTSSRSTLTMVPSTMSPSLKYLIVLSMAARKSSLEPMSLTATWGEVTVGLGILLGCSGQVEVVGTVLVSSLRLLDGLHAGQTQSRGAQYYHSFRGEQCSKSSVVAYRADTLSPCRKRRMPSAATSAWHIRCSATGRSS